MKAVREERVVAETVHVNKTVVVLELTENEAKILGSFLFRLSGERPCQVLDRVAIAIEKAGISYGVPDPGSVDRWEVKKL